MTEITQTTNLDFAEETRWSVHSHLHFTQVLAAGRHQRCFGDAASLQNTRQSYSCLPPAGSEHRSSTRIWLNQQEQRKDLAVALHAADLS